MKEDRVEGYPPGLDQDHQPEVTYQEKSPKDYMPQPPMQIRVGEVRRRLRTMQRKKEDGQSPEDYWDSLLES